MASGGGKIKFAINLSGGRISGEGQRPARR
jgi:hypothetical protein